MTVIQHLDYPAMVERCRSMVLDHTDIVDRVAVVSRGDAELSRVAGRQVSQFPADATGRWLGYHPADGGHAVQLLAEARHRGATHLLLPCTADWWLEHYGELAAWLAEHAVVVDDRPDAGRLFALPQPDPPDGPPETTAAAKADADPGSRRWLDRLVDDQAAHLLAVVAAATAPGADVRVVVARAGGFAGAELRTATHLLVPAAVDRNAPHAAERAHRIGARHRALLEHEGLGSVYILDPDHPTRPTSP